MSARPPITIVLPFHGDRAEAARALDAVARIEVGAGDEVVVVDNSGAGAVPAREGVRVVTADAQRSSYYARNVGAASASGEWLLFVDADCRPRHDLVERYFAGPIDDACGVVVGEVVGVAEQDALVARYARSRGHLGQAMHVEDGFRPWGVTANLLVRRAAWASVGGFQEGIRSTGDAEFCWRTQDAGWSVEYRPEAVVEHAHRERVRTLVRQAARYGAGRAWLARRYPEGVHRPTLVPRLARCVAGVVAWTLTGRFERATFKALDAAYVVGEWAGYLLGNVPPGASTAASAGVAAVALDFPSLDAPEPVAAARALGARVEATARPIRVDREAARELAIAYAEDDGTARRLAAAAWLVRRSPLAALRAGRTLLALAPAARRIVESGASRVVPLDSGVSPRAVALAKLAGKPLGAAPPGGAAPSGGAALLREAGPLRVAVLVDQYPALSETFVVNEILALARIGQAVSVEAAAWASPAMQMPAGVAAACLEDDGQAKRARDLAWLVARHPVACARDLRDRRRWAREEPVRPLRVLAPLARRVAARGDEHLHVHFAGPMALDALRLSRLLGVTYSVTAHAYDIYREPRNLAEKLRGARVATGVAEYSAAHMRDVAGREIHVVPMGVDHGFFTRRSPYPGGRHVVAVGRLVPKKGFADLVDAAVGARVDRLTIVGDGPLRAELERRAAAAGLDGRVDFAGSMSASGVRDVLETADLLVMPAVPVADGDRDVLPMVVGEALAMEVPVVATDFVGLPEVVREPWGRLVSPNDPAALADAIAAVLDMPAEERAAAGRAGREFAVATRDLDAAARRLVDLIRAA